MKVNSIEFSGNGCIDSRQLQTGYHGHYFFFSRLLAFSSQILFNKTPVKSEDEFDAETWKQLLELEAQRPVEAPLISSPTRKRAINEELVTCKHSCMDKTRFFKIYSIK
jgi:hypothetical protein